jgi:RNA polymerase sigma-70 factor (ECF subfamily)
MAHDPDTEAGGRDGKFPSTRMSIVEEARGGGAALEDVIRVYWKPVYKYIRLHWNKGNEDAKDLTQGFFLSLIDRELIGRYDRARGAFRTYLRTCVDGFVANENAAAGAVKRGGGTLRVDLDFNAADRELAPSSPAPPDELFLREWQREVFSQAVEELRRDCSDLGKASWFRAFELFDLADDARRSYEDVARELGIAVTQVTNHLSWCRRELRRRVIERVEGSTPAGFDVRADARAVFR